MKEQLITFDTAKLAKEKGFFYGIDFYNILYIYNDKRRLIKVNDSLIGEEDILAPTQSLLQKWVREIYMLEIIVYPSIAGKYTFKIYLLKEIILIKYLNGRKIPSKTDSNKYFKTHEEALERGLQEALKLLKERYN